VHGAYSDVFSMFSLYVEKQVSFGDVKSGGGANVGQKMIREKKVAKVFKAVAVGLLLLLLLGRGTAGDVIYALRKNKLPGKRGGAVDITSASSP